MKMQENVGTESSDRVGYPALRIKSVVVTQASCWVEPLELRAGLGI